MHQSIRLNQACNAARAHVTQTGYVGRTIDVALVARPAFSAYKFRRQHPYGPYILDFFCLEAKVDIEIDGFQHGKPEQQIADHERDLYLEKRGIKVLRFWNSRLRREKEVVRDTIWRILQAHAPHPLPGYCGPTPMSDSQAR